jgi:hypothetical protein
MQSEDRSPAPFGVTTATALREPPAAAGCASSSLGAGEWFQGPVLIRQSECPSFTSVHYPVAMSDDYAARFRKQAEECREQAAKAVNPIDKEASLRLAEEWLKMASSVDARGR